MLQIDAGLWLVALAYGVSYPAPCIEIHAVFTLFRSISYLGFKVADFAEGAHQVGFS